MASGIRVDVERVVSENIFLIDVIGKKISMILETLIDKTMYSSLIRIKTKPSSLKSPLSGTSFSLMMLHLTKKTRVQGKKSKKKKKMYGQPRHSGF